MYDLFMLSYWLVKEYNLVLPVITVNFLRQDKNLNECYVYIVFKIPNIDIQKRIWLYLILKQQSKWIHILRLKFPTIFNIKNAFDNFTAPKRYKNIYLK